MKGDSRSYMEGFFVIFCIWLCSSCATTPETASEVDLTSHVNLHVLNIGGFKLEMTPRAVMAVIQKRGYRESTRNTETLEDIIEKPPRQASLVVYEFPHGEDPYENAFKETGDFTLGFFYGRLSSISYHLRNISKEKLQRIQAETKETFAVATNRQTQILQSPGGGTRLSLKYDPSKHAFLSASFIERDQSHFRYMDPPGRCDYSVTVLDHNPALARSRASPR